ncbi:hypothetical protein ACQ4M5_00260 [Leptolyngbya sp. AN10]
MPPLRVLTLKQPYASLVALHLKQWETRPHTITWDNYRGLTAIHAGAKSFVSSPDETIELLSQEKGLPAELESFAETAHLLPTSQILCITRVIHAQPMSSSMIDQQSYLERCVGYWQIGRKAIQFTDTITLENPVSYVGMQGLTQVKDVDLAQQLIDYWKTRFSFEIESHTQLTLW